MPFHQHHGAYTGGLAESHPIPLCSLHDGKGFFQVCAVPDNMVDYKSVVGIEPGDSGEVVGYQVYEFTCTWSAECFIVQSHIYPGFAGKLYTLTHFPLKPGCKDNFFLTR